MSSSADVMDRIESERMKRGVYLSTYYGLDNPLWTEKSKRSDVLTGSFVQYIGQFVDNVQQ